MSIKTLLRKKPIVNTRHYIDFENKYFVEDLPRITGPYFVLLYYLLLL